MHAFLKMANVHDVAVMVVYMGDLTVPTVPLIVPRPIEPELGDLIVEKKDENFCTYLDSIVSTEPLIVTVTQTLVSEVVVDVDVVVTVEVIEAAVADVEGA